MHVWSYVCTLLLLTSIAGACESTALRPRPSSTTESTYSLQLHSGHRTPQDRNPTAPCVSRVSATAKTVHSAHSSMQPTAAGNVTLCKSLYQTWAEWKNPVFSTLQEVRIYCDVYACTCVVTLFYLGTGMENTHYRCRHTNTCNIWHSITYIFSVQHRGWQVPASRAKPRRQPVISVSELTLARFQKKCFKALRYVYIGCWYSVWRLILSNIGYLCI